MPRKLLLFALLSLLVLMPTTAAHLQTPTKTPKPSVTPRPTNTPRPTSTPRPTATATPRLVNGLPLALITVTTDREEALEISTETREVTELRKSISGVLNNVAWSPDGTKLAYVPDVLSSERGQLMLYDAATETAQQLLGGSGRIEGQSLTWSPNGRLIAYVSEQAVYVYDMETHASSRLFNLVVQRYFLFVSLRWSPDGARFAYRLLRGIETGEVHVVNTDGSSDVMILENDQGGVIGSAEWTKDNRIVATGTGFEIISMGVDGKNRRRIVGLFDFVTPFAVSPDGQFLVGVSGETLKFYSLNGTRRGTLVVKDVAGLVFSITWRPQPPQ